MNGPPDVTAVLHAVRAGNPHAADELFRLVYGELRQRDGVKVMARRDFWMPGVVRLDLRSRGVWVAGASALVLALAGGIGVLQANRSGAANTATDLATEWLGQSGSAFVSTNSLVALRFYQEGTRAYYGGRPSVAHPLFDAAVREDSTFAMAWYYLGRPVRNA